MCTLKSYLSLCHHVDLNEIGITREEEQKVEYPQEYNNYLINIYIATKLSSGTALWPTESAKFTISVLNMKSFVLHKIK